MQFTCKLSVDASAGPVDGKIEVTLPNFALLEAVGLYVLEPSVTIVGSGHFMSGLEGNDAMVTRPTYVAAPQVFSLEDVKIRPASTTSQTPGVATP